MWFQRNEAPDNTVANSICKQKLKSMETHYSSIRREALSILHGLVKFHHLYFAQEESIITDHKPLVTIFKKDAVRLSHSLQRILF